MRGFFSVPQNRLFYVQLVDKFNGLVFSGCFPGDTVAYKLSFRIKHTGFYR